MERKRGLKIISIFLIMVGLVLGALYFINLPRGVITYSDNLGEADKSLLEDIFKNEKFKDDITFSSEIAEEINQRQAPS